MFYYLHFCSSRYIFSVLVGVIMQNELVDIPETLWLIDHFKDFANPKAKIKRLVESGTLIRLKRGLYVKEQAGSNPYVLGKAANKLYGPSYVSFAYALRWYGLIPEHVPNLTSATYGKRRFKRYDTPVGSFFYRDVPKRAYPFGLVFLGEGKNRFLAAGPKKALCDELSTVPGVRSVRRIENLLFDDLRIDPEEFRRLDFRNLSRIIHEYKSDTLSAFTAYIEKVTHD